MARASSTDKAVNAALSYARSVIGTPYVWWDGQNLYGNFGPFWVFESGAPKPITVRNESCTCTGLINLLRRRVGLPIPGLDAAKHPFAGGTWYWTRYLKRKGVLEPFDSTRTYPKGTMLLRPYRNALDQGHVAVVYSRDRKGVLYSKLIHAYPRDPVPKPGLKVAGGVALDPAVGTSHFWNPRGFYLYACLPCNWLGRVA